jgi:hypothetical protein
MFQVDSDDDVAWFYQQVGVEPATIERLLDIQAKWREATTAFAQGDESALEELLWLAAEHLTVLGPERLALTRQLSFGANMGGMIYACNPMDFDNSLAPALMLSGVTEETVAKMRDINQQLLDVQAKEKNFRSRVATNKLYVEQQKLTTADQRLKAFTHLQSQGITPGL